MDLSALTRFENLEDQDFKLTKIGSKRPNSMVGVGQFEVGSFSLFEYPITAKHPAQEIGAVIEGPHLYAYLRTSPIVKIVDQDENSTTFETEGGIYKLEKS